MTPEEERAHHKLLDEVQGLLETKTPEQLKLIRDFIRNVRAKK